MVPGEFSNFVDDAAAGSAELQKLLSRRSPDPRMRDVELLVRFLAMKNFLNSYAGRMKGFLDAACEQLNASWAQEASKVREQVEQFQQGADALISIFEVDKVARKQGSRSFNRAIFDALAFYASDERIRARMLERKQSVVDEYARISADPEFMEAVESDTAGIPHTLMRLALWGSALSNATNLNFRVPELVEGRIRFEGFWA